MEYIHEAPDEQSGAFHGVTNMQSITYSSWLVERPSEFSGSFIKSKAWITRTKTGMKKPVEITLNDGGNKSVWDIGTPGNGTMQKGSVSFKAKGQGTYKLNDPPNSAGHSSFCPDIYKESFPLHRISSATSFICCCNRSSTLYFIVCISPYPLHQFSGLHPLIPRSSGWLSAPSSASRLP